MFVDVNNYLNVKAVAIVAVSRNPNAFSRKLFNAFLRRGLKVYPVNMNAQEIDGVRTYQSISELPSDVEAAYIIKRRDIALEMAKQAAQRGIKKIWIHVKCDSAEADALAAAHGLSIISGQCFFMWAEPLKGVHWFHRFIHDLFHSQTS